MVDDLAGYLPQLEAAAIEIERPLKQGLDLNLQAWIRDPDGNQIELMQISMESPQRAQERAWTESRSNS